MPGKDRLIEIVKESVNTATDQAAYIESAAGNPRTSSEAVVSEHARVAKEAIDTAAEACKVLVREEGD